MAEQQITLEPGESRVVTFEATPHEVKAYNVTVDGLAGSFSAISAPPPTGLIGDLNDDGVIDSADLDILSLYIMGYPISQISPLSEVEFLGRADVNEDGVVNVLDISALEQLIEVPGGHFVSCEVPASIVQYADFWASQRVWLMVRAEKLYNFQLLLDKSGVSIDPSEYAQPWYGISEEDVIRTWNRLEYLPTPAQLTQIFPVDRDDFYEGRGYALWGASPIPCTAEWKYGPAPPGVYKVISRCSIISCRLVETPYGPTIQSWGQWEKLWETDTGKTIEIVRGAPPPPPPPPAMLQITGFSVPSSAKAGSTVTAVVTYKITGEVSPVRAELYATNEFADLLATSSALNATPGTHTVTLTFTAWYGTILMNVYCYIRFATQDIPDGWAYSGAPVRITITNLVY